MLPHETVDWLLLLVTVSSSVVVKVLFFVLVPAENVTDRSIVSVLVDDEASEPLQDREGVGGGVIVSVTELG